MTWLESHQELRDHPKTRKLGRRLGGLPAAIGHLHCLWWWCLDYAEGGDLSAYEAEDIAIAAMWEGDPETLVTALVECGFLDRDGDSLTVHDWMDYGGKTITRRLLAAERKRRSRTVDSAGTSRGRHARVTPLQDSTNIKNGFQPAKRAKGQVPKQCPCGGDIHPDEDGKPHCVACYRRFP